MKRAIDMHCKIGIAVDLWSDKFKNIHYLGVVAHYIVWDEETNKPSLVTRLLALKELEADVSKTADVLHNYIFEVLHEFDLQNDTDSIVFISDRGKNIVNACDGYSRNSCFDHFVNNIVCDMVKEIEATRINIAKVLYIIYSQFIIWFITI